MPTRLRRVGAVLLVLLLLAYAHSPTALSGFVGEDFATLVAVEQVARPERTQSAGELARALFSVPGAEGHPLAAASLVATELLWSPARGGPSSLVMPRVENLLLLCLAAWAIGRFVRRLFWPWVGSEHGSAAGRAASLLVALHPASIAAVATLGARGDLLAIVIGVAGANLFLKSRQEHDFKLTACSAACVLAAGLCSSIAFGLPVLLGVAEYTSARRYRPDKIRRRTAVTTLILFAAFVAFGPLVGSLALGLEPLAFDLAGRDPVASATVGLVRFGTALLPANLAAGGVLGFFVCGVVLLAALQPVPIAARSAPRLWGWLVTAGVAAVVLWEACSEARVVRAEDFTHAATLLPLAAVLGATLGFASTAVSGLRRYVLPIVVAAGWAFVGHQNAEARAESAFALAELRGDLLEARQTWGLDTGVLVLDPPRRVRGVDALEGALPAAVDPLFAGRRASRGTDTGWVRGLSSEAFVAFVREPEFTELRKQPLIVSVPTSAFGVAAAGEARRTVALPTPKRSTGMHSWFREGRAVRLDLETLTTGAVIVRGTDRSDTDRTPILAWRATEPAALQGTFEGVWSSTGEAPEAVFDLSSSVAWLLGGRAEQIWSEQGWSRINEARVVAQLPVPSGAPTPVVRGEDWLFEGPREGFAEPGVEWRVVLLDLATLESASLVGVPAPGGALEIPGAALRVSATFRAGSGPVAWSLERRIDGRAVERARGRRVLGDE